MEGGDIGVGNGDQRRVLRFLARSPATLRQGAASGKVLLEARDGTTIAAGQKALDALLGAGTVTVRAGEVRLARRRRVKAPASARDAAGGGAERELVRETRLDADGRDETLLVDRSESPLAQLAHRRNRKGELFLDKREFMAGERLRSDFTRGQLMPRLGIDWSGVGGSRRERGAAGGMAELTDAALAARERVERALSATGPELSGVLVDVCCFLKGLERVETERGWPVRSAKVVLKTALAALARHYEPPPRAPNARRRILQWGTEDYRPVVNAA